MANNSDKFRVVVFISGRGSNFEALAEHIEANNLPIEVCLVLSDKKNAAGLEIAKSKGIETAVVKRRAKEQTTEEFNLALAEVVKPYKPDLIVLAGFMRVLKAEFISVFPNKVINIHPSLLPAFKGLDVQQRAIDAGVKESGCTVHMVVEEVDSGPILGQSAVPVLEDDTADILAARILKTEHKLLPKVVEEIASGKINLEELCQS